MCARQLLLALLGAGAVVGASALRVAPPPRHRVSSPARARLAMGGSGNERSLGKRYDLVVLGAGPTGITAAVKAAQLGRSAILIDDPGSGAKLQVGGPSGLFSKALRDVSKRLNVRTLRSMGILDSSIWAQAQSLCKEIALVETQNTVRKLQQAGVPRIQGAAAFDRVGSDGSLVVRCAMRDGSSLLVRAERALIATGSRAWAAPGIPLDGRRVFDSDSIKRLSYLPTSVVITGSGIIAIEFAKIFSALGAHTTLLVRGPSLGRCLERFGMDGSFGAEVKQSLEESGIQLLFNTEVVPDSFDVPASLGAPIRLRVRSTAPAAPSPPPPPPPPRSPFDLLGGARAPKATSAESAAPVERELECSCYMLAAGRDANTASLNLGAVGISADGRGNVQVDEQLRTACRRVWAAGDVLGPPSLASTGVEQATAAIAAMFAAEAEASTTAAKTTADLRPESLLSSSERYPVGIWTTPEMAYFGRTLKRAREDGIEGVEGVARYSDTLRGHVNRCSIGSAKLVVGAPGGEVLGVFLFGDEACELVHYGMELVVSKRTVYDVRDTMFAAVTYHELFKNAAEDAIAKLATPSGSARAQSDE